MKKVLIFITFSVLLTSVAFAEYTFPSPNGYVNDYAGVIDQQGYDYINSVIELTEQNTTAEIAVATFDTINESGLTPKMYAVELFNKWGVGKKGKDNGVLVLLVLDQRRIEIEVGYGLEGILPDGKVGRIIRDRTDYFKNGNYSEGLQWIVHDLSNEIMAEGEYSPDNVDDIDSFFSYVGYSLNFLEMSIYIGVIALSIAGIVMRYKKTKCPKCGKRMKTKIEKEYVIYTCPNCHYKKKEKRKYWIMMAGAYGGSSGGGFSGGGGFGGGSSGGGGAGGSF